MSDTQPVLPQAAPPSYTESQYASNMQTATAPPIEDPPPYSPPEYPAYNDCSTSYQQDPLVVHQHQVVEINSLGPNPCWVKCPACHQDGATDLRYKPGHLTCLCSMLCFLFCIICTLLPCCIADLQDVEHYCSHCGFFIGTHKRL